MLKEKQKFSKRNLVKRSGVTVSVHEDNSADTIFKCSRKADKVIKNIPTPSAMLNDDGISSIIIKSMDDLIELNHEVRMNAMLLCEKYGEDFNPKNIGILYWISMDHKPSITQTKKPTPNRLPCGRYVTYSGATGLNNLISRCGVHFRLVENNGTTPTSAMKLQLDTTPNNLQRLSNKAYSKEKGSRLPYINGKKVSSIDDLIESGDFSQDEISFLMKNKGENVYFQDGIDLDSPTYKDVSIKLFAMPIFGNSAITGYVEKKWRSDCGTPNSCSR